MRWKRLIPVSITLMSALALNAVLASAQQPAQVTPQPAHAKAVSKTAIRQPVELTEEEMGEVKGEVAPAILAAAAAASITVALYVRLFLTYAWAIPSVQAITSLLARQILSSRFVNNRLVDPAPYAKT